MSFQEDLLPVYILKWKLPARGRGRHHAAIFISNPAYKDELPMSSGKCLGTLLHALGAPMSGFSLNIRRNWDVTKEPDVEEAHRIASIKAEHVWAPETEILDMDDTRKRGAVDRVAMEVRPPGPTQRPWVAEEVMDCQDWLIQYVERLVLRKLLEQGALDTAKGLIDPKTALMPDPNGTTPAPSDGQTAGRPSTMPITASIMQPIQMAGRPAQTPSGPNRQSLAPSSSQRQVGQSEWNPERGRFERENYTASQWEYRDTQSNQWLPM